ncbi:hypothetical protein SCHPADRAFT_945405 [Schizopora paradoxa]|uniref:Uncharacterized protein n=1 Tax=Schizopora paradoxa TaxID=27342 RepID=A0A0H2R600_9AGAM|nr:hypothetical protein SCHPADRAFT_945405 [Schizopora paradoxa]
MNASRFYRYIELNALNWLALTAWLAETKRILEEIKDSVDDTRRTPDALVLSRSPYAPSISLNRRLYWYSYLYDLDHMVFIVNDWVYFLLDSLPPYDQWVTYIAEDGARSLCILPSTPDSHRILVEERVNSISRLTFSEQADLKRYEGLHPEMIDASSWASEDVPRWLLMAQNLAKTTFTGFVSSRYSVISTISINYDDLVFQDLAMELLTSAAPANSTFSSDSDLVESWIWKHDQKYHPRFAHFRNRFGEAHPPKRERCNAFWFRGRLIVLARTLQREDHFKAKVGFVVRRAREKGLSECTALLWSVHHVAVVVVSGEQVFHSKVIPVVAAYGKKGADSERQFDEGVNLLTHYLYPIAADGGGLSGASLPLDILVRIMELADNKTSTMLEITSKAFRLERLKHPRIGHFVVTGPSPDGEGYLSLFGKTGRAFKITLHPIKCLSRLDKEAIKKRRSVPKYVVYRLPFHYLQDFHSKFITNETILPQFARTHGYEVRAEEVTPEGKYSRMSPLDLCLLQPSLSSPGVPVHVTIYV